MGAVEEVEEAVGVVEEEEEEAVGAVEEVKEAVGAVGAVEEAEEAVGLRALFWPSRGHLFGRTANASSRTNASSASSRSAPVAGVKPFHAASTRLN